MLEYINKLKVRTKLTILTGILILGMIVYGALSTAALQKLSINGEYYNQISDGQDLIADILPPPAYIIESYLLSFEEIQERNSAKLEKLIQRSESLQKQFYDRHRFWEKTLTNNPARKIFLEDSYIPAKEFFNLWETKFLPALRANNKEEALQILNGPMKDQYNLHRTQIDEVIRLVIEYDTKLKETIQELGQKLQFFSTLSWLITILLGILLGSLISYSITNRLRQVLKKIHSASHAIDVKMNEQSISLDQQSESVHKTTDAMNELNNLFIQAEDLVAEASNRAKNSLKVSEEGNKLVKKMLEGLSEHKDKVLAIVEKILHLSEIIKQIHNIAAVTGNLSNQTNILALNAAVQAAQVKQHSEGFSVIASEIRKLADESKKFLSQIDILSQNIKEATDSTVVIAEEGSKTVQESIKLAKSSAEAFDSIIAIAEGSYQGTEQVSKNVNTQGESVARVQEELGVVNSTMRQTQIGMKEVREELDNLDAVSEELKTIV